MRALRLLAVVLLVYGLTEMAAFTVYSLVRGEPFSFARMAARRGEARSAADLDSPVAASAAPRGGWAPAEAVALHPYLGYVRRPGSGGDHGVDALGFIEKPGTPPAVAGETITVAITGGSFAEQHFARLAPDAFDFLAEVPRFRGRRVRLVSLALRGYKQPQQLLAASYVLSLGEPLDVLINLDGFNEIALADQIRRDDGVHPSYPYHWAALTRIHFTPQFLGAAGEIGLLRDLRASAADAFAHARASVAASVLWDALDRLLQRRTAAARARLERSGELGEELPDFRRGPANGPSDEEFPVWAAALWERSSLTLAQLAADRGIDYFHFLQPNQYVEGSKVLTQQERETATTVPRFAEAVRRGYPLLRAAGRRLAERGVAFHDLTPIFAEVPETLYVDRCCHVGDRGNRIVAEEIRRAVAEYYTGAPGSR